MTKKEILQDLVNDIAELTNQATSKEEAINKGLDRFLHIDYASVYGGYRLVSVAVNGGAHHTAFIKQSYERQPYKTFEQMLRASLNTLRYVQNK